MTLITAPRLSLVLVASSALLTSTLTGTLTGSAQASGGPVIDRLDQHYSAETHMTTGQPRDSSFYGQWDTDGNATPSIVLTGANGAGLVTTFVASSPAPDLARRSADRWCVTQRYYARALDPASASASYRTTLQVRRHGKVVYRHTIQRAYTLTSSPTGDAPGRTSVQHDRGRFHFHRRDVVLWTTSGRLTNQIKKFRSAATVTPTCRH